MGLPTSFLGLEREPGNKVVGLQLGGGGGGEVRYFANSLHAGAAMMGSKTSSILQFSLDTCSRLRSVLSWDSRLTEKLVIFLS